MKLGFSIVALAAATLDQVLEAGVAAFNVKSSWEDGFLIVAQMVMSDTSANGMCATLPTYMAQMDKFFQQIIQDDKTNTYLTIAWCGKVTDSYCVTDS